MFLGGKRIEEGKLRYIRRMAFACQSLNGIVVH